jgi:hypothetical protein
MKKIRRRNGTEVMVDDDYVIQDGEGYTVPMQMMDSMITDAHGRPAGCRPGFLYDSGDIGLAVRETLHRQYCDDISQRWRSDRWQKGGNASNLLGRNGVNDSDLPSRVGNAHVSSVDAAYQEYRQTIENRWRR